MERNMTENKMEQKIKSKTKVMKVDEQIEKQVRQRWIGKGKDGRSLMNVDRQMYNKGKIDGKAKD